MNPDTLADLLGEFDKRYPHTEFECLIGENEDVIDLLQKGRAQLGLTEARNAYPTDISAMRLPMQSQMDIYVAHGHPLAQQGSVSEEQLRTGVSCGLIPIWKTVIRPRAARYGLRRAICCCSVWRNRDLAGAHYPVRWWMSFPGQKN